jgi:hypothetical protein
VSELLAGLEKIVAALVGILFAIGGYVWKKTDGRVDALEKDRASKADLAALAAKVDAKADNSEMTIQRGNIKDLFEGQSAIRSEMHGNHITQMTAINTIATQVAMLVGRMEK